MKNILIGVVLLIIVIIGGYYALTQPYELASPESAMDDMTENTDDAPAMGNDGDVTTIDGTMPVPGVEVPEMIVTREFTVEGSNFKFAPSTLTVKKGETVRIIFKNTGGFHDFVIDEFNVRTKQFQGGTEETVEFVAHKTGSFEYYCSVGTHRAMGMKGILTVTE